MDEPTTPHPPPRPAPPQASGGQGPQGGRRPERGRDAVAGRRHRLARRAGRDDHPDRRAASTKSTSATSSTTSGETESEHETDVRRHDREHDLDRRHGGAQRHVVLGHVVDAERHVAHDHERELSHEQDPLVRRPLQRHRRLGPDPRHHRVGSAARHQGAGPPAGPGVAAQPPPLPRRARGCVRGRARRRDPARQLHRLRDHRRAGAVHRFVAPIGRRLGHRRHVPAGRDRDHIAAAPPHVEAGMARGAPAQLLPVRDHDRPHAHGRHRREGAGRVERRGAPRVSRWPSAARPSISGATSRAAGGEPVRRSGVPSARTG